MSHHRPVIGLSTYDDIVSWYAWENKAATLVAEEYLAAVWAAGGAPVLLPSIVEPDSVLDRIDAVVLVGGPDVGASRYGGEPHELAHASSDRRDEFELGLIDAAEAIAMPLLGICRGAQLLNVARGGTLHQHIPEVLGHEGHSPGSGRYGATPVQVHVGSRLAEALGVATLEVDCFHHQAIDTIGSGLAVSALADDGTIEAIEDPHAPFVVGVQWHPEEGSDRRLLEALAAAAMQWRSERDHS